MKKQLVGVLVGALVSLVSVAASADETPAAPAAPSPALAPAPTSGPAAAPAAAAVAAAAPSNVKVLKPTIVYGRRQMPSVVVEIQRLSAAHEAGVAHESLHNALVESSLPAALRQK